MFKKIVGLSIAISVLGLSGCATNASSEQMTVSNIRERTPKYRELIHNISVANIAGGHETNPLWTSKINNANFKMALEQSLKNAKLYHQFNGERFQLNANLVRLDQPFIGLDLKVTCLVHYSLQDVKAKKNILDKDITTSYTATFSDSPVAITRLKIANEGAARTNIQKLIDELYRL